MTKTTYSDIAGPSRKQFTLLSDQELDQYNTAEDFTIYIFDLLLVSPSANMMQILDEYSISNTLPQTPTYHVLIITKHPAPSP